MAAIDQIDQAEMERFIDGMHGAVLYPGDDGYGEARSVWNGMVDRYPSLIARCTGADDVQTAVDFAREHGLPLSVKGGGHNVAGRAVCDDGLMIDCALMDAVTVDPEARVVEAGPGCRWADVDAATQEHGLATTGGVDSRTGIAGLTLGGGWGWMARKHGLSVDNLRGVEMVTAGGELVRADEGTNPDLFWAVRGGGGNFGVVTSFEYDLHPVGPEVMTAQVFHPQADLVDALRHFRDFMLDAPDEVGGGAMLVTVPPMEPFPEDRHGETAAVLAAAYIGDPAEGASVLNELTDHGDPFMAVVDAMAYTDFQQSFDEGVPDGERYYYKSQYLAELPDEAIETVVDHADELPGPFTMIGLEAYGGAINRVSPDVMAYPHRDAAFNLGVWAGWSDPDRDEAVIEWTRTVHEAMRPYSTGGVYANYLDQDDDDRSRGAVGDNFDRLVELKRTWDPDNLFDHNVPLEPR